MRIHKFRISNYRVLGDVELDFESRRKSRHTLDEGRGEEQRHYSLDFIAGLNGAGKSTILQVLGGTFARLAAGQPPPTQMSLVYDIEKQQRCVTVEVHSGFEEQADKINSKLLHQFRTSNANGSMTDWQPISAGLDDYLPSYVVVHTSGDERAWRSIINGVEHNASTSANKELGKPAEGNAEYELPGWMPVGASNVDTDDDDSFDVAPSRVLFVGAPETRIVVLCGLLASRRAVALKPRTSEQHGHEHILHNVLQAIRIQEFLGFSLRIRAGGGLIHRNQGDVIDTLSKCADRIVEQGNEKLLVFDLVKHSKDGQTPKLKHDPTAGKLNADVSNENVYTAYGKLLQLYQKLIALCMPSGNQDGPLREVNLFFKRALPGGEGKTAIHLFDWFSDGERSFLSRMALFALFGESNVLILLDEPEVHFNDVWKREIVAMLDKILSGHRSHALITTHSSITLTDVERDHIMLLQRDDAAKATSNHEVPVETLGADPSDIIVGVFGTRHAAGSHSVDSILRRIAEAKTIPELEALRKHVAPGYWRYRIELEISQRERLNRGKPSGTRS